MTRKRSIVWSYYKDICPKSVVCVLCKDILFKHEQGSTTRMWRHLRTQHPTEAIMAAQRESQRTDNVFSREQEPVEIDEAQVEVELEEENPDAVTVNQNEVDSAINGILVAVKRDEPVKETPAETTVEVNEQQCPAGQYPRRSLIWKHFKPLPDLNAAQCQICKKKIMCTEGRTSNLYRHMAKTHPHVNPRSGGIVNEADRNSDSRGVLEADRGEPVEEAGQEKEKVVVENPLSSRSTMHRRSSVWKHFKPLGSPDVAQCLICKKTIRCIDGKTSNLHRHISKSHPKASRQAAKVLKPTKPSSPSDTSSNLQEPCPMEVMDNEDITDEVNDSKVTSAERRILKREQELIEALRRTQREEAKALEHQRELIESLRGVNAREAAMEKKQIESLRRAQQEEAKDLMRQREELETERAEQQKRREELEQEKKQLLMFCQEPPIPALVSQP
ncbi:zinc finger BED domain-containing protein [Syngnathus typhle]|uniref:zinc finger BED domain-containing protein n=1 Tax=Syngnathus typhle TaxID=161592 RepID=UPI002A6A4FC4|nr:zinc finger BED domain-containing protein [Syngnathus typhle]